MESFLLFDVQGNRAQVNSRIEGSDQAKYNSQPNVNRPDPSMTVVMSGLVKAMSLTLFPSE